MGHRRPMSPEELAAAIPYAVALGIRVEEASATRTRGSLMWTPERTTLGGGLHGGALMTLADTIGAICAYLNLPDDAGTATIESKTNFFRAIREGSIHATSHPLHLGRSIIVVQTEMSDDQGRRTAMTTQTQAVITG